MSSETIEMDMGMTADRLTGHELGVRLWQHCYRGKADDALAMKRLRQILHGSPQLMKNDKTGETRSTGVGEDAIWDFSFTADASFLAMWVDNACARLETSHRYASALMCTSAEREIVDEIELPWKAFALTIPSGLVEYPCVGFKSGMRRFREVRIATIPFWSDVHTVSSVAYLRAVDEENGCLRVTADTVADLLFEDSPEVNGADPTFYSDQFAAHQDVDRRALTMMKRLVVGLLLAFVHTDNFRDRLYGEKGVVDPREGKPAHRVILFGRPLDVDCRSAVREFLIGRRRGLPSVQTLVRGHQKRQVIGVGRTGRKVIWVEPYWRGRKRSDSQQALLG